ncbi:hypothetical protein ACXX82_00085 [Glaciimonas sp. GNP009]
MLGIFKEDYFKEHYANGFVETNISLSDELVDEIRQHYLAREIGHNDFPKFFVNNEHLAYMEGKILGLLLNTFPKFAKNMVRKFYDRAYSKAVYCEQVFIEKVLKQLLENDFQRFFDTRYMLVSYDMYLHSNHLCPAAGIHTDFPNFHHFYETENDLSLYIPLIDLDEANGGRLRVLPESKLKVPGNILLKMMYQHFSADPACLDENGYVDPNLIGEKAIDVFIKSKSHQALMSVYKNIVSMAKNQYADAFSTPVETKGKVMMFNNKNFHAAEAWKNEQQAREIYVIRMFPIYDIKIKLKDKLHGELFNNFLLDFKKGVVHRFEDGVDLSRILVADKLAI